MTAITWEPNHVTENNSAIDDVTGMGNDSMTSLVPAETPANETIATTRASITDNMTSQAPPNMTLDTWVSDVLASPGNYAHRYTEVSGYNVGP